ncbi:SRPBCC family protein [Agromyces aerolatus]|uniref:SRPBCC family protein n=1 Tax=Agromyces sp. LY-1074 TaxID=3074080 RepID=UPI002863E550|nr:MULTISPECIES: SRPBCC family protein [unclassified Agromyces]MDR5699099.1 SRPBCC family protein [Agromyces sp. LY-1074]MDR5705122.1 SRPBCC family protein [Agromyces sp. LY-1358]
MNTIEVRGEIAAPSAAVWAQLGDFGGVATWNPFVEHVVVDGDGIGMTRTITARGGARIVERLEHLDHERRHLRYAVRLESGAESVADIRLEEAGAGATTVVWQSIRAEAIGADQQEAVTRTLSSRIEALAQALAA